MDYEQEVTNIAEDTIKHKYKKLVSELEQYTGHQYPQCLLDVEYVGTKYREDDEFKLDCICGHHDIRWVNYFSCINNPDFTIGSVCIDKMLVDIRKKDPEMLKDVITKMQQIENNIQQATTQIKEEHKQRQKKECGRCGSKTINKKYNYAREINNHFCKDCCKGDKLKCKQCNKLIKLDKDWQGNYKLICLGCWKFNKNNKVF